MKRINVTKTFLPPLSEYEAYLKKIWENDQLTNQGPLLKEFEISMRQYFGVDNFHFVSNGTTALQLALRTLGIKEGEVITTPFSYVATTSAILWERCVPVFVDIEPNTFCIDPDKIEAAITPNTKAIMAVHVFGNPCNIAKIQDIARRHNLKVIYDGAHAFGVKYKDRSLLSYGDVSTCSFHATKLFHTIEGGAVITPHTNVSQRVELMKRFGHNGDEHYMLGINGKASEFQAAMGLANLPYIEANIRKRKGITQSYNQLLTPTLQRPLKLPFTEHNYAYYPIVFKDEKTLLKTIKALHEKQIYPRRYFYPSLNQLPYIENTQQCPISEEVSRKILCLPLYADLTVGEVERIAKVVNNNVA